MVGRRLQGLIIKEEAPSSSTQYRPLSSVKLTTVPAPVELGLCDESVDDHASAKQRRLLLSVPYQRGDCGVPLALSPLQRRRAIITLEVLLIMARLSLRYC